MSSERVVPDGRRERKKEKREYLNQCLENVLGHTQVFHIMQIYEYMCFIIISIKRGFVIV